MLEHLLDLSIEEIKEGYSFDGDAQKYTCNICGKAFFAGEVYKMGERFFESGSAVRQHVLLEHPSIFELLSQSESRYLTITDNQKNLFQLIHAGLSDNEIAKEQGISPSTVRHQKFMFREKAKQAKLYLALYEIAVNKGKGKDNLMPIHHTATMVDERYITTREESGYIISNMFSSLSPLKLKNLPPKEKKKIIILKRIAEEFERGKRYPEKSVNAILKEIYEDYATVRRYLIEYGFMERTKDCSEYWLKTIETEK